MSSRLAPLDGLRGIAAAAVLALHYLANSNALYPAEHVPRFPLGHYGVPLFFMISGFVILLTAERRSNVSDFTVGRAARLYPAYWASIGIAYAIVVTTGMIPTRNVGRLCPLLNLTMLQHAMGVIDYVPAFWTLYVELQFYVVVALLLSLKRVDLLPVTLGGLSLVGTAGAVGLMDSWPELRYAAPLIQHAHLFLFGVCMFRMQGGRRPVALLAVCAVNAAAIGPQYALTVGTLSVVFALSVAGKLQQVGSRPLVFLGTISYSLYLLHQPIGEAVIRWCSLHSVPWPCAVAMATVVSLVAAWALAFGVEKPVNAWLVGKWRG